MLYLLLACNGGPTPCGYGAICDAQTSECPSDMECADATGHGLPAGGFRCSVPCQTDADCPIQTCGYSEYAQDAPYRCSKDGYCLIECPNGTDIDETECGTE